MASTVATLRVLLEGKDESLSSTLEGAQSKLRSVGESLTGIGKTMTAAISVPLLGIGTGAVMAAASLEQAMGKVNTVFGDSASQILDWSTTTAESLGISRTAALDFSGTFGMILQNMGFTEEAAADVSMQLVATAADMTAMTDVPLEQSLNALRAALVGEMEPLKNLGMGFNQADIEAKALALGLWDGTGALDANAKAQAILALITDRTAIASGMFAAEADGASGSLLILKAQLADAAAELGMHLLPYVTQAVHFISDLIGRFQGLDQSTQKIVVIVGVLAAAMGPVLIALGMMASGVAALIPVLGLLLGPIGLVVAAIAALYVAYQTNFLGFADGVNRVVSLVGGFLQTLFGHFDELRNYFGAIIDDGDYFNDWLTHFPEGWQPTILMIGKVVAVVAEAMPRIKQFVTDMISAVTSALQGWVDVIQGVMQVLKGIFTGDWELIKTGVVNIVTGLVEMVKAAFEGWKAGASLIMDAMKVAIPAAWEFIKARVIDLAGALKEGALNLITDLKNNGVQRMTDLKNDVVARVTDLKNQAVQRITELKNDAVARITDLKNDAIARFTDLKSDAIQRITDLKNDAMARITDLKTQAVQRITELKDSAVAKFTEMKDSIIAKGQELLSGAGAQLDTLKTTVVTKFTEAKDSAVSTVSGLVDDVVEFFAGLPGRIVEAIGDLSGLLTDAGKQLIGGLTDGITNALPNLDGVLGGITDRIPDIKGPPAKDAKLLEPSGRLIMGGLLQGIRDGWRAVERELGGVTGDIGGMEFGMGGGGGTVVNHNYFVTPEALMQIMRDSKEGAEFARNYGLEIALMEGV